MHGRCNTAGYGPAYGRSEFVRGHQPFGGFYKRPKHNVPVNIEEKDVIVKKKVRYRTVGDMTCTAAVESKAYTIDDIIAELKEAKISERGATRMDDRVSEAAMEDRKKGGYF